MQASRICLQAFFCGTLVPNGIKHMGQANFPFSVDGQLPLQKITRVVPTSWPVLRSQVVSTPLISDTCCLLDGASATSENLGSLVSGGLALRITQVRSAYVVAGLR